MKIIENNCDYFINLADNCENDCYLCEHNAPCGSDGDPYDRPAPSCWYD